MGRPLAEYWSSQYNVVEWRTICHRESGLSGSPFRFHSQREWQFDLVEQLNYMSRKPEQRSISLLQVFGSYARLLDNNPKENIDWVTYVNKNSSNIKISEGSLNYQGIIMTGTEVLHISRFKCLDSTINIVMAIHYARLCLFRGRLESSSMTSPEIILMTSQTSGLSRVGAFYCGGATRLFCCGAGLGAPERHCLRGYHRRWLLPMRAM